MSIALPTGRRGQIAALAIAVLAAVLIWLSAVAPLLDAYDDRTEALRQKLALASRMYALAHTLPALRAQASIAMKAEHDASALLPGQTDALAAAALQQRLDELAKASNLRIGSVETMPVQPNGAFRTIGLRVTLHAPYRAIVGLLRDLARDAIPMVLSDLSIRGPSVAMRDPDRSVETTFTVVALRAAAPAAATKVAPR